MMGGLHIEMAALKLVGTFLKGSGCTTSLEEAKVATSGTAESFISASNVAKTRRSHQITACSLYALMRAAKEVETPGWSYCEEEFKAWCSKKAAAVPMFKYWHTALNLELAVLGFVGTLRGVNFARYKESLAILLPKFFSGDKTHYSRWLTIHLLDMVSLEESFPDVYYQFMNGKFVIQKTSRAHSGIDQAH